MPNQDSPFFVVAEGARLLGPFQTAAAAYDARYTFLSEDTDAVTVSAAELAILRDRLAMLELRP